MKNIFLKNEKGQGVMEYVILSALIGIFCLIAVRTYGQSLRRKIMDMNRKISNEINIHESSR